MNDELVAARGHQSERGAHLVERAGGEGEWRVRRERELGRRGGVEVDEAGGGGGLRVRTR